MLALVCECTYNGVHDKSVMGFLFLKFSFLFFFIFIFSFKIYSLFDIMLAVTF
jgi:hypothetical protein